MDWIVDPEMWIALATLTALEIVLGIDNIIFISITAGKLPQRQQGRARQVGLLGAMLMRIALLSSITWVMQLRRPLFAVASREITGRDLILVLGGLFLLAKSTWEIHENLEGGRGGPERAAARSFTGAIVTIMLLDIVFSLDSVITAVGMARQLGVMIAAVVIAVGVMMLAARPIAVFVDRHPTVKMLALSFLLLIGFSLVGEGFGQHVSKGYMYFAMGFSVFVEMINIKVRATSEPLVLHRVYEDERSVGMDEG